MRNCMKTYYQKLFFYIIASILIFVAFSCGTSTNTRYSKSDVTEKNDKNVTQTNEIEYKNNEDFDITPYKTVIEIPEKKKYNGTNEKNIWFDYGSPETDNKTKSLVGTEDGYRVQVLVTDDLDEANRIKSDVYFTKSVDEVYVDFEPPFYKVKVGDFSAQKSAEDLRFKLNQLGYKDAKVIKDKINIFK